MNLIPLPYRLMAIALAVAALAAGVWGFAAHQRTLGEEKAVADQTARALTASIANQAVSAQRVAAIQEVAHAADVQASAARADAAAARTADQRLRDRLAALSRASAAHPAASGTSAPAGAAGDLYTDVLGQILDASRLISAYADQSRIAGQACEQSYDALTAK